MVSLKKLCFHLGALALALALFSASTVYAASNTEIVSLSESAFSDMDMEGFLQQNEPGIADDPAFQEWMKQLLEEEENTSSAPAASDPSSAPTPSDPSSEPASSTPSSAPSSAPESSDPSSAPSSEPASSDPSSAPSSDPSSDPSSASDSSEDTESKDERDYSIPFEDEELEALAVKIAGIVQREIVGVGTTPVSQYYEAYKAQALATHSYMIYYLNKDGKYPDGMLSTTPHAKTLELVRSVVDELIYYNGSVINAVYHAASGGATQSASYVWGGTIPYLVGVSSTSDANELYERQVSIPVATVQEKLSDNGITPSGDPSTWFDLSSATYTDGGFVNYLSVCGQSVKGRDLREKILGASYLKSCKIISITVSGDNFVFSTRGFGHGVGLSQYGALSMSAAGYTYKQILQHYYTGVEIRKTTV